MKKIYNIYVALLGIVLVCGAACTPDTPIIEGFDADTSSIEAKAEGGEFNIAIRSGEEWTAVASEPWVMISPANGRGEVKCIVKIDSTLVNDTRTTHIRFSASGELLREVAVSQEGYAKHITPEQEEYSISASANRADRWFETEIVTNVDFEVVPEYGSGEDWLTVEEYSITLDRGARPRSTRLHFNWKMNPEAKERVAYIHLVARNSEDEPAEPTVITVRQQAAPLIEDNREGDSLAILTIYEKLECWGNNGISSTESMSNWSCVRLWEATDKGLPEAAAIGRVRDLELSYFNTEEGIPQEIKYLKYLETLSLFGNVNTMLKSIEMGEEVCSLDHLKALRVAAYGIATLPKNFTKLGDTLEILDLNSNNLVAIPEELNPENFPELTSLNLASNRRVSTSDLRNSSSYESGIGMHIDTRRSNDLRRLLRWDALEELVLSYNYIEGSIPDFQVGVDGVEPYRSEDIAERGDTLLWAVESGLARILPNMKHLTLNLNFFTGKLPDWLLYHPRLLEWNTNILLYPQQESSYDSEGNVPHFDNTPSSQEYYFEKYPLMRGRFEFNDEIEL
ncbi:MAG: hypothetical protein IKA81_01415 [Alistipes sp.]|nr:hypothetical protein [Alistipes sp.]